MGYYSIQDYFIYIAILLIILWFFYRYFFRRIELDRNFVLASIPYILGGILVRVLADASFFPQSQWWSITPGVYVLAIGVGLIFVFIGLLLKKHTGIDYWTFPLIGGFIIDGILLYYLIPYIKNPVAILYPVVLALLPTVAIHLASPLARLDIFRRKDNMAIIFAHLLDGSASFYGIQYYGFLEEHLLPRFLIELTGSAIIMIPLKLLIVLLVVYLLEKWHLEEKKKDETFYRILKFVIFILGIGPGLRNSLLPSFQ